MFQFPPFAPAKLVTCLQHARLPHSEITGSIPVCSSPVLIAAYHVLHRLQKPRHPPFALVTFSLFVFFEWITRTLCLHLFSFTRCLEIAVHNVRIDSLLYHFYLVTDYLISFNFTSLSFLKLVNELFFFIFFPNYASDFVSSVSHYLKVTPSLLTRLPLSRKKYFEELLCNLRHCTTVYVKKTFLLYKASCLATHREARVA